MAARLLVVEDSVTVRKAIEIAFRSESDYAIEFATTGQEALERARATAPDLILSTSCSRT
jgi:CheY-like chemotaxis protein